MTPPPTVHRVIARLNVGGPAMHVVNLARGMDGEFDTTLIAGAIEADEGDMAYYAEERGVDVTYVHSMARSLNPLADLGTVLELYRLFRRDRPQIVHTHTAKAGTVGRVAAWLAGVPVRVHTFHGHVLGGGYFSPFKTRLFLEIERQLARITSRIVVLTDLQRDEMADELHVAPRDKFAVVPLGLELDRFAAAGAPGRRDVLRAETRAELGLSELEPVVGIVGRLVPVKNHELLIEALAILKDGVGETPTVLIIGGGEERAEDLRRYAEDLGVAKYLRWLGWRQDLPELLAAMDVVALTSLDEGTPVALIEALAFGSSVVARSVGGVPAVLGHGKWGRLVDTADPLSLAEAIRAALEASPGPAEWDDMRASALERFSVDRLSGDMTRLYHAELEKAQIP